MTKVIYDPKTKAWERYNPVTAKWEPANIGNGGGITEKIEVKNKGILIVENGLITKYIPSKE
jgi:hypothetical protein